MPEQNLAIVRKSMRAWNAHDAHGFSALLSHDYIWESDTLPEAVRGPQDAAELALMYFKAFPDSTIEVESMFEAGDQVITRWRVSATHRGEFMGISATHKRIDLHGCTVNELKDGKITRGWVYYDNATLLQQIGVLPAARRGAGAS